MSPWRRWLTDLYYWTSVSWRRRMAARWAAAGRAPVMVLFYHRVADGPVNAWTCPCRAFARQMSWIKAHCDVVSLPEAQARIAGGDNRRPTVSVTFDDGYADNMEFALPLLVRERIPCTYFVTTRNVLEGTPFPHDAALGRPLAPNTVDQLRTLAAWGIDLGAHTRTHADLGAVHDAATLFDEVVGAAEDLANLLDRPVRYFAFPYGQWQNLNPRAFAVAREAGFAGVCSAYGGYNFPGEDSFHLQRIHGDPEFCRLRNWLTFDPRKLHLPRFEYAAPEIPRRAGVSLA